jgi:hypothetical protein
VTPAAVADTTERWGTRMLRLAGSFPTLAEKLGTYPRANWDAGAFAEWTRKAGLCSGARHAAAFVLSVWNPSVRWSVGRFDAHRALAVWDRPHREAFAAWVRDPWWP